jgi:hypothetical protein
VVLWKPNGIDQHGLGIFPPFSLFLNKNNILIPFLIFLGIWTLFEGFLCFSWKNNLF